MKTAALLGATAVMTTWHGPGVAAELYGWADEFIGNEVHCNTATGGCTVFPEWNGYGSIFPHFTPRWAHVGQQGANATGRANAREKSVFRFRDSVTTDCATATVTLTRFRLTSPPGAPASCLGGTYVATVAQTIDSCGLPLADTYYNNRLLPALNFAAETAAAGTTIGYRTSFVVTASNSMGGSTLTFPGCYKIAWIP